MLLPEKAQQLIKDRVLGVISSVNRYGHPESALVGMAISPDGEIVFGTQLSTRKYQNILENRRVSIVFSLEKMEVQLEGDARPVSDEQAERYQEVLFAANPAARRYADDPGERYVAISVDWVRWVDYSAKPVVEEYGSHDEEEV